MRAKIILSLGVILGGSLLIWNLGADQPKRLIPSLEGPDLYRAYCAVCHGTDARGKGPLAIALKVAPSDLTRIAERNGGVFPTKRVQRIISGEEALPFGHGTREMPLWGDIFSQVDHDLDFGNVRIDNVSRYLKTLQTNSSASSR